MVECVIRELSLRRLYRRRMRVNTRLVPSARYRVFVLVGVTISLSVVLRRG